MSYPYAVIQTGGKQYCVREGQQLCIERLTDSLAAVSSINPKNRGGKASKDKGAMHSLKVLALHDGKTLRVGMPYVEGVSVTLRVVRDVKSSKVIVFKKHRRKRYRRLKGHRQNLNWVSVESLGL